MYLTGIAALIISFCLLAKGAPSWKDKGGKVNGNGNGKGKAKGHWKGTPVEGPADIVNAIGEGQGRRPPKDAPPGQKKKAEPSFLVNPGPPLEYDPLEHQGGDDIRTPPGQGKEKRGIFYKYLDTASWVNKWPKEGVPYEIDEAAYATMSDGKQIIDAIHAAMADYHTFTCIKFVKRTDETTYIWFSPGGGCWSYVGMYSGKQQISLDKGCGHKGIVIHEMLHALGFFHEQSRPDREDYLTVMEANINPSYLSNFNKMDAAAVDTMGFGYDYLSIMHYGLSYFTTNGQATMKLTPGNEEWKIFVGQRTGFSSIDINEINQKYECPNPLIYPDLCVDFYQSYCSAVVAPNPEVECLKTVTFTSGRVAPKWEICPKSCDKCHWEEESTPASA